MTSSRLISTHRAARLLEPTSIAVIGASADGPGTRFIDNIFSHGYRGSVFPVNPRYSEIAGLPCYPTIEDVPGPVDLAAIRVPAERVPAVLRGCVDAKVGSALILVAGFAEDERGVGKALQTEIDEILEGSDLVVCGPNSEGYLNLLLGISASPNRTVSTEYIRGIAPWIPAEKSDVTSAVRGGVAVLAQSGGLAFSVFSRGVALGIGFSHVISLGNELDIDVLDCVEYLITRPEVKVIGMYVEGFHRPERLGEVAEAARSAGKSLVIGKAGSSDAGKAAALSHTGHLAGEAAVYEAAFRRHGVIQVGDQEELLDICAALATAKPLAGSRVAIVSWSGGSAVWTADALDRSGFSLPELDPDRQEELGQILPPFASLRNPIDVTGASQVGVAGVMRIVGSSPDFDALILITTLNSNFALQKDGDDLAALVAEVAKPILVYSYTEPSPENIAAYGSLGLPLYPSSQRCVRALAALRATTAARSHEPRLAGPSISISDQVPENRTVLSEAETTALLVQAGVPAPPHFLARSRSEAVRAAANMGGSVVLKVQAPSLAHKAAAGGLILGLQGASEIEEAFASLDGDAATKYADYQGILVQQMVSGGIEMLVGINNTSGVGPMIMLGIGGSNAERIDDTVMECCPLNRDDASRMISALRHGVILDSDIYSEARYDKKALVDLLVLVSDFAVHNQDLIAELDINPVIVKEDGLVMLDSLMVLKAQRKLR